MYIYAVDRNGDLKMRVFSTFSREGGGRGGKGGSLLVYDLSEGFKAW